MQYRSKKKSERLLRTGEAVNFEEDEEKDKLILLFLISKGEFVMGLFLTPAD